ENGGGVEVGTGRGPDGGLFPWGPSYFPIRSAARTAENCPTTATGLPAGLGQTPASWPRVPSALVPGLGRCRTARPSITHDQPLKIRSIPTNRPITHKAASGRFCQIITPRMKVMT